MSQKEQDASGLLTVSTEKKRKMGRGACN